MSKQDFKEGKEPPMVTVASVEKGRDFLKKGMGHIFLWFLYCKVLCEHANEMQSKAYGDTYIPWLAVSGEAYMCWGTRDTDAL